MSGARTVCPSRRWVVTAKQRNRTWRKKYGLKVDLVAMRRFPDLQLALTTHQVDAAVLGYVNIALMEENNIKNYKIVSGVYVAPGSLVLAPDVADKVKTWKDLEGTSLGKLVPYSVTVDL